MSKLGVTIQDFEFKRVLVAHNVKRGLRGGMARMMESIHAELESFGWKTEFFTHDDMPAAGGERFRRYAFPWYVRRHARKAFLRGEPYDVINIHEPAGAAVVIGKSRLGWPAIVAMSHGLEQRYWELRLRKHPPSPEPPSLKTRLLFPATSLWQSRLTLRRANHVFCMSEEDRTFLENRLQLDPRRITRVFPGTGPEFLSVAPRRSYDRSCNKLLFSGSWIDRKGARQIVEAFSVLADRHPSMQLGILGAGVLASRVVADASRVLADFPASLHSRITVFPPLHSHADYAEVHLDYDIFLQPSFFEGMPATLIQAMGTGMPVIATATCGMKDVVEDGRNGLLIAPGNSGQIVGAIELLMTDSSLRRRLGQQAFSDAARKFTWRAVAELVNAAYSSLPNADSLN
jgi:glycosyltransferase involved in cell wall biosynthesis